MTVSDDIKNALRETFNQQLGDVQTKINATTNALNEVDAQIQPLTSQIAELRDIKQTHQQDLNRLQRRLQNIQLTLQKLEGGDIIIR